jgi:hypothetical protein
MFSLLVKVMLIYVAAWAVWTLLRSRGKAQRSATGKAESASKRFDTSNRDVADAEFEELRE